MSQLIDNLNTIESVKTDIRSAIEAKGVGMSGVSFPDYPAAISQISGGGAVLESITIGYNGTYTPGTGVDGFSQVVVSVASVGNTLKSAAEGDYGSSIVDDTTVSYVAYGAFAKYVNFDSMQVEYSYNIEKIPLVSVNLPNCSVVGNYAFRFQDQLVSLSLPNCKYIGAYAFTDCYSLNVLNLPSCEIVGSYGFSGCTHLQEVNLPVCEILSQGAFWLCNSMGSISLPQCSYISSRTFYSCTALSYVYIGGSECRFENYAFLGCTSLRTMVLAGSSVYELASPAARVFQNTPLINGPGSGFYVNDDYYSSYLTAQYWSNIHQYIHPMSELQ